MSIGTRTVCHEPDQRLTPTTDDCACTVCIDCGTAFLDANQCGICGTVFTKDEPWGGEYE